MKKSKKKSCLTEVARLKKQIAKLKEEKEELAFELICAHEACENG